jgi:hypothetical protein
MAANHWHSTPLGFVWTFFALDAGAGRGDQVKKGEEIAKKCEELVRQIHQS